MEYKLRPIRIEDLDGLYDIACLAHFGLTSLPKDKNVLESRILDSINSFSLKKNKPGSELYIFILEELNSQKIIGTSAIVSKVGGFEPFYAYKKSIKTLNSKKYAISKSHPVLNLIKEHNGPSEITTLFTHPDYRQKGIGKLLSLSRFLFMALHQERFENYVIAEMRGVVDSEGVSPFWNALGSHFFDMEYSKADYLSITDKSFIADLMPQEPIYIELLPEEAQNVIGEVHKNTRIALELLKKQGFSDTGLLDIFDAGPIYGAPLLSILTVKNHLIMDLKGVLKSIADKQKIILMTLDINVNSTYTTAKIESEGIYLPEEVIYKLNLKIGDQICVLPIGQS